MSQAGLARISSGSLPPQVPIQFTGNSGVAVPALGNLNVITANTTVKFVGSGSTLTEDFGLTNLLLGVPGTSITSATINVGLGQLALRSLTSGNGNVAVGWGAGASIAAGINNTFVGTGAGASSGTTNQSNDNTGIGSGALAILQGAANGNTAIGKGAAAGLLNGSSNVIIGQSAGNKYLNAETNNILLCTGGVLGESNTIRIGEVPLGSSQHTRAFLAGVTGVTVAISAPIAINASGQLSSLGLGSTGQLLTSTGVGGSPTWQSPSAKTLITKFTSDGSWTIDPRTAMVDFFIWGGGGGGGSGRCGATGSSGGGGGGGAGTFSYLKAFATDLTSSPYTVTLGAGGAGGASINAVTTNGNPGIIGGNTTIGTVVSASGGAPGQGGINGSALGGSNRFLNLAVISSPGSGGSGATGIAAPAINLIQAYAASGGGGSGYAAATPRVGAAGNSIENPIGGVIVIGGLGGANTGATAGDGNSPSGQLFTVGGTGGGGGGHDGVITSGSGGNGAIPSGGGGGGAGQLSSNPSGAGGNGAKGQVIIIEYF